MSDKLFKCQIVTKSANKVSIGDKVVSTKSIIPDILTAIKELHAQIKACTPQEAFEHINKQIEEIKAVLLDYDTRIETKAEELCGIYKEELAKQYQTVLETKATSSSMQKQVQVLSSKMKKVKEFNNTLAEAFSKPITLPVIEEEKKPKRTSRTKAIAELTSSFKDYKLFKANVEETLVKINGMVNFLQARVNTIFEEHSKLMKLYSKDKEETS